MSGLKDKPTIFVVKYGPMGGPPALYCHFRSIEEAERFCKSETTMYVCRCFVLTSQSSYENGKRIDHE